MLKKLLSLVLVFGILLSVTSVMGVYAEETVVAYEPSEGAYELVSVLGIMECEDKNEFANTVTRGELAKVVSSLAGMEGAEGTSAFNDVPADHPYAPYINSLYNASVVSGSATGIFNPDKEVSFNEAITMVVRAMGYTARAEANGGYPTGYLMAARQLKLFENLEISNRPITKGEMVQLSFNALEANALVFEGVKNGEPMYGSYNDTSLGEYVFGVKHITGVVEAVDLSALQGENELSTRYIMVDGVKIFSVTDSLWGYLGYEADVWYRETRKGINEIVYIRKSDYNKVTEILLEDIINISDAKVEYYDEDGDKKTISYRIAGPVIYNTVATYETFDMSMLSGMDGGFVRLISNDGDKTADVVVVEAYKDYVVSAINGREMKLYDKFNKDNNIILDTSINDPYTIIYDSEGTEIFLKDIDMEDILSIYASKTDADQKFIKVIKHTNKIEGTITEVAHVNGKVEIKIGDKSYTLTKRCYTNCSQYVAVGAGVSATLNLEGLISNISTVNRDVEFVYLMALSSTKGLESKLSVKVLKMDKTFAELELSDRLSVDKNDYTNGSSGKTTVLQALMKSSKVIFPNPMVADCVAQPVQIKLDSNGKISYIDTVLTKDGTVATKDTVNGLDALYRVGSVRGSQDTNDYRLSNVNYANKFLAPTTTPTILIPSPENAEGADTFFDEEAYAFTTGAYFNAEGFLRFHADAFSTKPDSITAEYMISPKNGAMITTSTEISVVKRIRKALLPDESEGYQLTVLTSKGDVKLNIRPGTTFKVGSNTYTPFDLNEGDVIKYSINSSGYVEQDGINLLFSPANKIIYSTTSSVHGITESGYPLTAGYVYENFSDAFSFALGVYDIDDMETYDTEKLNLAYKQGYAVGVDLTEGEGRKVYGGSLDDILGYEDVGTDCSFVYISSVGARIRFIVIVNGYDN